MTTLSQPQVHPQETARRTALVIAVVALMTAVISLAATVTQRSSNDAAQAARPAPVAAGSAAVAGVPADAAAKHAALIRAQKAAESDAARVRPSSPRQDEALEDALVVQHKVTHGS